MARRWTRPATKVTIFSC